MRIVITTNQEGKQRVFARPLKGRLTASLLFDILADLAISQGDCEIVEIHTEVKHI